MFVVRCLSCVVRCLLCVGCCLFVVCCMWCVVRCVQRFKKCPKPKSWDTPCFRVHNTAAAQSPGTRATMLQDMSSVERRSSSPQPDRAFVASGEGESDVTSEEGVTNSAKRNKVVVLQSSITIFFAGTMSALQETVICPIFKPKVFG